MRHRNSHSALRACSTLKLLSSYRSMHSAIHHRRKEYDCFYKDTPVGCEAPTVTFPSWALSSQSQLWCICEETIKLFLRCVFRVGREAFAKLFAPESRMFQIIITKTTYGPLTFVGSSAACDVYDRISPMCCFNTSPPSNHT